MKILKELNECKLYRINSYVKSSILSTKESLIIKKAYISHFMFCLLFNENIMVIIMIMILSKILKNSENIFPI